jgi:hypothetical protein
MGVSAASGYPQYSGSLISPMFSMELLERFYTNTVYSDISTTEYSGELEKGGDQITFWREPEVIVRDAYKNKKIEHDTINAEPVTMIIDRAKEFSIKVSHIDEKQIQNWPKWKESFLRNAGYQLAQAIDPDLMEEMYTAVAAANQGANAGAQSGSINLGEADAPLVITSDNIIEVLSWVHQVLDEAKAPRQGRFIILPPAGITALRNSDLQAAYMTGLSWSPLTNGRIPEEVMGFVIMESLNLPSETDVGTSKLAYHLIAGVKMATAFAAQLEKTRVIEDKDEWATFYQGLTVYGFKVLYPEALVHIYATFDAS